MRAVEHHNDVMTVIILPANCVNCFFDTKRVDGSPQLFTASLGSMTQASAIRAARKPKGK